ncbi:hypothetical protein DFJ74DRAFT_607364 [Hyaloraphidium curvatum]|nr:hypothetical protein DFJ74DRAFT_607364 [Hyaloraphidium curvatum]
MPARSGAARRVAVVGSGVASMGAVWCLTRHPDVLVDIFEAGSYPGGHTHTVYIESLELPVDTGFIVMNPVTYPNFLAFLAHLHVRTVPSDMSFAVSRRAPEKPLEPVLEWAGAGLRTLFADWRNLWVGGGGMWRLALDAWKFGEEAEEMVRKGEMERSLISPSPQDVAIGDFFKSRPYSTFFYENYILPMTAAIWSTPAEEVYDGFPFDTLVRFMRNHKLLELGERPQWLTVENGSRSYVSAVLSQLPSTQRLHLNTAIRSLRRERRGSAWEVFLTDASGKEWGPYDAVVMGCHGDQALEILGEQATEDERRVLGRVAFTKNRCVLHRDPRLMPANKLCWSSWNYLTLSPTGAEKKSTSMCLTYWMNKLQPFLDPATHGDVFVTVNPFVEPEGKLGEWTYEHPRLDAGLVASQEEINAVQNKAGVVFAGAWTNYGFHGGFRAISFRAES